MKNSKALVEKIERENNFSGPAEWLEPGCFLARGVDRAVLYEANRLVRKVVSFLSTPADQMTTSPRPVDCDVAKNREGALATMKLVFVPETATIREEAK